MNIRPVALVLVTIYNGSNYRVLSSVCVCVSVCVSVNTITQK